ncbi:bifunctional helix-turn-helix transcriptional regulator/GNAT family N-acetyltransferase [Mycolicibacterium brisbanense]|uniref:Transcriptional regulator n=1 Tax=Mycolicibacterium brisbanense TaxID=146020 RepID=A0A124E106_9MYCO|nr:helix-turn-helix domain-containing GNAT family N-acetyltransferase [Mycolicibacterium brisbanense]MCV7162430.1 MarR family transcriptional regulator [Mycolicibacterium brisbanense]GAS92163.1 transcriptional regulator [Mycolicibacterium brisbanense]
MSVEMVAQVRRFNRVVTRSAGVLNENFLASGRSLGQDRLLWEIGTGGCDVRDLRERLGLDSGYLSRLLRALQREGLVTVAPSDADGRVRTAQLTDAGRRELDRLNEHSDDAAAAVLRTLTDSQQDRLVTAMAQVERLLTLSAVQVDVCDPGHPDARYCLATYYAELAERFTGGYDPAVSPVADAEMTPPAGLLLVASLHGRPVGCGAVIWYPDAVALVKRMWVAPSARGLGLGRRILTALESHAQAHGARLMRLDTNAVLIEAQRMYRSCGYREVEPFSGEVYADHWFEKPLPTQARGE